MLYRFLPFSLSIPFQGDSLTFQSILWRPCGNRAQYGTHRPLLCCQPGLSTLEHEAEGSRKHSEDSKLFLIDYTSISGM